MAVRDCGRSIRGVAAGIHFTKSVGDAWPSRLADTRRMFEHGHMSAALNRAFFFRPALRGVVVIAAAAGMFGVLGGAEPKAEPEWRMLPLITDGKVNPDWVHVGWGGFVVDDGTLRTECDAKGLGLLVYKKERLGNCQIRVVYKSKDAK